jgi:hypothetical protein
VTRRLARVALWLCGVAALLGVLELRDVIFAIALI